MKRVLITLTVAFVVLPGIPALGMEHSINGGKTKGEVTTGSEHASQYGGEDCSMLNFGAEPDGTLTQEERRQLEDKVFFSSIDNFDRCQEAAAGGGGGGGSSSGGTGGGGSIESTGIKGTAPDAPESLSERGLSEVELLQEQSAEVGAQANGGASDPSVSGKVPEDIPSPDNDSAFQQQLRQAAQAEKDPVISSALWNEYRKSKGLPVK